MYITKEDFEQYKKMKNTLELHINNRYDSNSDEAGDIYGKIISLFYDLYSEKYPNEDIQNLKLTKNFENFDFVIGMKKSDEFIFVIGDYETYIKEETLNFIR